MERSTNALAELAKWLECDIRMIEFGNVAHLKRLRKVKRIVAELAKVNTLGPKHIPGDISLYTAYAKCRAIAEEGAVDDK